VFGQTGAIDPWIVVVDDSSPLPAENELEWLDTASREKVRVIQAGRPDGVERQFLTIARTWLRARAARS